MRVQGFRIIVGLRGELERIWRCACFFVCGGGGGVNWSWALGLECRIGLGFRVQGLGFREGLTCYGVCTLNLSSHGT